MYRTITVRSCPRTAWTMLALLGLALAGAAPTLAADPLHVRSAQVSFADLDLSQPTDVAIARERVHQMARKLCGQVADSESLAHQPAFVSCIETAMAKAEGGIRKLAAASTAQQRLADARR